MKIGKSEFKYKKDALIFYKTILNSYDFGTILNESDTKDVISLIKENKEKDKFGIGIKETKIGKVQYGTKGYKNWIFKTNL